LRAMREHTGGFSIYPIEEELQLIGYSYCGGCPGGNIEYVPQEMLKNGAEAIHLATGMVVGYPPCPRIKQFKEFIESYYGIPVVIGTHPIPLKYYDAHRKLSFWKKMDMASTVPYLMEEDENTMRAYD